MSTSHEITCGYGTPLGCGATLRYPAGASYVRCAVCDHVTATVGRRASPSGGGGLSHARRGSASSTASATNDDAASASASAAHYGTMRCVGCDRHISFPTNATHVRCAACDTVNLNGRLASRALARFGGPAATAMMIQDGFMRSASRGDTAYLRCSGCRVTLAYPNGSSSVRCAACGTVTLATSRDVDDGSSASSSGGQGGARSPGGGGNSVVTSRNLVVIENPPTVTSTGKVVSNIAVGVKLENE
jgi:LSD1 subclass zinc finger protein